MLILMLLGVSFKDAMVCNFIGDLAAIIGIFGFGIWMHHYNKDGLMTSVNAIADEFNNLFEKTFKGR